MAINLNRKLCEMHSEICKVLTNPKRIEILYQLRNGEKSVGKLASLAGLTQTNASQLLSFLRQKRMVVTRREGATIHYSVANPKIFKAMDIMREVLLDQLREEHEIVDSINGEKVAAGARKTAAGG